ncbi:MAG: gliding motility-associated C-terminal domain-containing protein [Sphingobacteriales bacterium]|nr:MAG: gliding motility-associated C-terminal domain-containing protein [Sphingobacteriales bacterium]
MEKFFTRTHVFSGILLFIILLLSSNDLRASHAMGADLTYGCLGSNQYLIILKFFRDCNGITPAGSYSISYSSAQCGVSGNITLGLVPPIPPLAYNPQDITPLCPGQESACGGNGQYGVQQWFYQGTLTLPPGCGTDWVLRWTECCRNNAITTLVNPGGQNLFVDAYINNTLPTCNTSPQFLNPPVPFTCVNEPVFYNHGVVDSDGDQLVFSLINCDQANNTNVNYAGAFNGGNPLSSSTGINVDPVTGDITFTPNQVQVAVMCVLVEEYRNGVKIGEVVRDMQVTVINCNNSPPVASGMNGSNGVYSTTICANQPLCFDIVNTDSNAGNTITTTWNAGIPDGTFTAGPVSNPTTSTFCWTPTDADVGLHFFTVTLQDNACPIVATGIYSYTVIVEPNPNPPVNAGADVGICAGGSVPLNASITGPLPPGISVTGYLWSPATGLNTTTGTSVVASPAVTTTYQVTAFYSDFCQSVDQVTVTVNPSPTISLYPNSNIVVCSGGSITINSITSPDVISYQWSPTTGLNNPLIANPTITPTSSGTYSVTVTNIYGCTDAASVSVGVSLPPPDVCTNFYVTPTGSGDGLSPNTPTNLLSAITQAACNNATIKMAIGTYTYDNPINIYSNMTIEGGFDPGNNWVKSSQAGATTIHRTALNTEGPSNERRIVAVYGVQISFFRLQDLTISTANGPTTAGSGASTYALHCDGCSDFQIVRTQLLPGNPSNGQNGVSTPGGGGAGGGGAGGAGGAQGSGCDVNGNNGTAGTAGSGGGAGGGGGTGGSGTGCNLFGCGSSGNNGLNGINGVAGATGTNAPGAAPPAPAMGYPFFVPGVQSASGGNGTPGGGGGGGGGAATGTCCSGTFSGNAAGGNGGTGGNAGIGGTGGFGGGGAFGAYLVNNGGGAFIDCNINQANLAAGGSGSAGQPGTGGTAGSPGSSRTCSPVIGSSTTRTGGNGGSGGNGGAGGNGQPGAPGVSSRIAVNGTPPTVTVNNAPATINTGYNNPSVFNLAAQPVITVTNVSCTYTNVTYTGGPFNNLGAGATSPTGPVTQYTTTGRKTIIAGANQYVGFHNIAIDGSAPPGILTTATPTGNPDEYFVCQGDVASFTSTITYGLTYNWNFGGAVTPNTYNGPNFQSVPGLTFNTPGTFNITHNIVTDCCGPSPVKQITLIVDPLPVINAVNASPQNSCQGGPVTLSVTGTAASFEWSPAGSVTPSTGTTVTANPTSTTTYQITALSASGNCVETATVTVTVFQPPTVSLMAVNAICTSNGGVNTSVSGGSGNYSYAWDTNGDGNADVSTQNLSGLVVGQYTVTVTDLVSNCQVVQSVNVNPAPGSLSAYLQTNTTASCSGLNDGTATIGAIGGTPPYSYAWSPNVSSGPSATGLAPGNYTVSVSAAGCTSIVTFSIFGPTPVQLQLLDVTPNTCAADNIGAFLIDASGGNSSSYTFDITGPNGFTGTGGNQTGLVSGNYSVTVTDANNCTATLNVNVPATDVDDIAGLSYPDTDFCQGEALTLSPTVTGVQGGSFTASPAGMTISPTGAINIDGSSAGTYTISYNTAGAPTSVCPIVVTFTLNIEPSPILAPIQTDACDGEAIDLQTLTPTTAGLTFDWFSGTPATGTNLGGNLVINASATGPEYWLLATDAATGCTGEVQLMINIPTPTFTTLPPPTPCFGETLDLTTLNGTGNGTFEWYDGPPLTGNLITAPLTLTASQSVWVLFTENGSGCQEEAEVVITLAPQPVFDVNTPPLPCPGEPITLSTLNGNGTGSFEWFDGLPSGGNLAPPDLILTANTNLWVLFTDAVTGCTDSTEVFFTYTPPPVFSTIPPTPVCEGDAIDVTLLNGAQSGTYQWFDNLPSLGNPITGPITINANTPVWVLFTDALTGCVDSAEVILQLAPPPLFSHQIPPSLCIGESLDVNTLNGFEPGSYEWYDNIPPTGNLITTPISFSTSNIVWLLFTDLNTGCQDFTLVFIPVLPPPLFSVNPPTAVCEGQPFDLSSLNGTGNGTFAWFDGLPSLGVPIPGNTISPLPGNSYWAVFTENGTGCTDSIEVNIPIQPLPTAVLSGNTSICPNDNATLSIALTGVPNWTIVYTDGTNTFNETATSSPHSITVTASANTTYTLTGVTDGNGCVAANLTGSATISMIDSPAFNNLAAVCNATFDGFNVSFTITGGDAPSYSVTGSAGGSITESGGIYTFTSNTIPSGDGYNFVLTDANNCNPVNINGNPVLCDCITDAGTMTNTTLTSLCDGDTFTALHNGDETLEPDDVTAYILHTNSSSALGTIIATNPTDGTFSFTPPMVYGTTYYVSLVAANDDGSGGIDFADFCLSVAPGSPVVFNALPTATLTGDADICEGDDATLTFTMTGTPPYDLEYSDSQGNIYTATAAASPFTIQANPLATTTYTLNFVSDANCDNTGSGTATITLHAPPQPVITGLNNICMGSTSVLDAGSGYSTYLWSDGTTTQTLPVTASGIFFVTVTNVAGCEGYANFAVTVNAAPAPTITGTLSFCPGNSTVLDAGAGFDEYLWTGGSTAQTLTVNAPGVYDVTVTDGNGCTGSHSVTAANHIVTPPSISGNTVICSYESTTLNATSGYASYLWESGENTPDITVNSGGAYGVTVTDGNGCTSSASVNVTVNNPTPVVIGGSTTFCTGGSSNLTATAGFAAYLWSPNGETSQGITATIAGNYGVTVTNAAGCTSSATVAVTESTNLNPVILETIACQSTELDAGNGFGTYLWGPNGETTSVITVTQSGTYSVTVSDGITCTGETTIDITIHEPPVADAGPDNVVCGYEYNLSANGIAGTWSYTGTGTVVFANPNSPNSQVTVTGCDVYDFIWTEDDGICQTSDTVQIGFVDAPEVTGTCPSEQVDICDNNTTINPSTVLGALCSDSDCPAGSAEWDAVLAAFGIDCTPISSTCHWEFDYLDGPPGTATVTFLPDAFTPVVTVTVSPYGHYRFRWVCDLPANCPLQGCGAVFADKIYNFVAPLQAFAIPICDPVPGSYDITLTISGDNPPYLVNGIPVAGNTYSETLLSGTPYAYLITGSGLCPPVNVSGPGPNCDCPPVPANITGDLNLCAGETTLLSATPGFTSYLWMPGANNTPDLLVFGAGTYSVTVTDAAGCTGSAQAIVSEFPLPAVNAGIDDNTCSPSLTYTLSGTPNAGGTWSSTDAGVVFADPANPNSDVTVPGFGAYTFTYTVNDINGCTGFDAVTINFNDIPIVNAGLDDTTCDLFYNLSATPATGGTWSSPDAGVTFTTPISGNTTVNVPAFGNYTFTYTVTDANGCTNADAVTITFTDTPVVNAGTDEDICGLTYTLSANPLNNGTWSSPDAGVVFANVTGANSTVTVPDYSSYTFTWTVTSTSGNCDGADAVTITFAEQLTTNNLTAVCNGLNYTVSFTISGGNSTAYTFTGSSGQYNSTTGIFTSDPITTGTAYDITITDGSVCLPVVVQGVEDCACVTYAGTMPLEPVTLCGSNEVTITNNGDEFLDDFDTFTYILHDNNGNSAGNIFAQNDNGIFTIGPSLQAGVTYYISAIAGNPDGAGGIDLTDICLSVAAGTPVSFTDAPVLNPIPLQTLCVGETLNLTTLQQSGLSGTFIWYDQNPETGGTPINATVAPGSDTVYWILYEDGVCSDTESVSVAVSDVVITDITQNQTIVEGQSITLSATAESSGGGIVNIEWEGLTGANPIVEPINTTTYTVIATDEAGCVTTGEVTITVIRQNAILIPNAFSPNSDAVNDIFRVAGVNIAEIEMFVYDRWGTEMFRITTNDIAQGWDGTHKGKDAELGVYVYYVNATFTDGTKEFLKGNVTLIR